VCVSVSVSVCLCQCLCEYIHYMECVSHETTYVGPEKTLWRRWRRGGGGGGGGKVSGGGVRDEVGGNKCGDICYMASVALVLPAAWPTQSLSQTLDYLGLITVASVGGKHQIVFLVRIRGITRRTTHSAGR